MIMLDTHIYGVHARDEMIRATASKLNVDANHIHYDDRPNGGWMIYTAKKAWTAPIQKGITHRVALADDVEVCDGFIEICAQIAQAHPESIISFFPYEFMERNYQIENMDTPYWIAHVLSGCAIMMPVQYIHPCFDFIKSKFNDECPDDAGIQAWADSAGVQILTTIPALIQHIGDESIANKGCFIRRTVYFDRQPQADFGIKKVLEYKIGEWFFSNHGKRKSTKGVIRVVP